MKKIFLILFLLVGLFLPTFASDALPAERGIVEQAEYIDSNIANEVNTKQTLKVKILTGKYKDNIVQIDNMLTSNPAYDIMLSKGDKVILHLEPKTEFIESIDDIDFFIADIERANILYILTGIFMGLLLCIGRKKGFFSFVSILATVVLIFCVMAPLILYGFNPIVSAFAVSIISTIITIYLVGGFNYKSTSAILGTVLSLGFAALMSILTIKFANLTGFSGEESLFLYTTRPDLDFTGLLSASMILAALGAVMDVGVSIASTINEIHVTDTNLGIKDLYKSGMNVGKDIIGTMSNTLILVYLGTALPLLMLANNIDFMKFFNLNQVATEISAALIGSIAILICVPITAIISAYLIKKKS